MAHRAELAPPVPIPPQHCRLPADPLVDLPDPAADLGLNAGSATLGLLRERLPSEPALTLVTATDGNHGRAVARMAHLLGIDARIYTPAVSASQHWTASAAKAPS